LDIQIVILLLQKNIAKRIAIIEDRLVRDIKGAILP